MDHSKHFDTLLNMFKDNFTSAYRSLTYRHKTKLLPYITCFYRRWYHSALIENTILTPANLLPVLTSAPADGTISMLAPMLMRKNDIRTISFVSCEYSLDKHPVTKDLEMLISFCSPDVELDEDDAVTGETADLLRSTFFIGDPFYIEYLTLLAFELGLLKKMPSVHSNRAQPTAGCDEFFSAPRRELLEQIFNASIEIASSRVLGALPMGLKRLDKDFILSLLKQPRTTDEIFDELYRCMGVDIHEFLNFDDDSNLDDIYNAMMSGTFYLGVILDKYFYTVFGYYLKFINPGYVLPSDFYSELEYAVDTMQYADDISVGMFAPCSHYNLTTLGAEFFGLPQDSVQPKLDRVPKDVIIEMLTNGIKPKTERLDNYLLTNIDDEDKRIFEVKVKLLSNKSYWKSIEFPHSISLHEMYLFLMYEFGCDINMNYSFYPDTSINPFSAYTSPVHKRRSKKADTTALSDFAPDERSKFLMVIYDVPNPISEDVIPVKELQFEMELTKIKPCDIRKHYPYVTRISQAFRGFEFDEEWF